MGIKMINENNISVTLSLNDVFCVRGQQHFGTAFVGGIGSPRIDAPAIPPIEECHILFTERGGKR